MLARLWANQVMEGNKTIDEVPAKLKNQVEEILIDNGYLQ